MTTKMHLKHSTTWDDFFSGAIAFSGTQFGAGNGTIYLDNVGCSGSENNLTSCFYVYNVTCANDHSQDAGVRCQGKLG